MKQEYFLSDHENDETINIKQQGVTNEAESVFTLDTESDTAITTLPSNSDVKISGTFKPKTPGKYVLEANFKYEEGEEVKTSAVITVIKTSLLAVIFDGLNDEVVTGSLHEVQLLVKNNEDFAETLLNIESGSLLPETISIELPNRKVYTLEEFNALTEAEKKLTKGKQIKIKGTYKAKNAVGPDTLGVKVNYRIGEEGSAHLSFDEELGGSTNVISKENANVMVTGAVSPQEKKMRLNGEEMVVFTFKNTSDKYPATGVEITITSTEPDQSEVKKN